MTPSAFKRSLSEKKPPDALPPALTALWWAGHDDWDRAHKIVMDEGGADCAWVHAYLHRKEGDLSNAGYWYGRAGKPQCHIPLEGEWAEIVRDLVNESR